MCVEYVYVETRHICFGISSITEKNLDRKNQS